MICLDELGPVAAKAYPGPSWSADRQRPHLRPSSARHGYRWAFGALHPRSGQVFLQTAARRDTVAWLQFLDGLEVFVPDGEIYLITEGVPLHWTLATMLWNWGPDRFPFVPRPKAAAWLNRIAGCWKILRQRALAGRDCTDTQQVDQALHAGVADWNSRPTPFLWGRAPKPKRTLKRKYIYCI